MVKALGAPEFRVRFARAAVAGRAASARFTMPAVRVRDLRGPVEPRGVAVLDDGAELLEAHARDVRLGRFSLRLALGVLRAGFDDSGEIKTTHTENSGSMWRF